MVTTLFRKSTSTNPQANIGQASTYYAKKRSSNREGGSHYHCVTTFRWREMGGWRQLQRQKKGVVILTFLVPWRKMSTVWNSVRGTLFWANPLSDRDGLSGEKIEFRIRSSWSVLANTPRHFFKDTVYIYFKVYFQHELH
jgi:hypothetical protein